MSESAHDQRVNILMVDDQPAKLLGYEAILTDLGENLIKAESAREALEVMLRTDVAVVLLDVSMPELDGFELAAMIRQHPRFEKTAIIFVSAIMLTDFDLLRGYETGAVDYVPVPIVPELLRAKVRVFVDLYRKTRQLERMNLDLEVRVARRTAELEAAAAQLRESEESLQRLLEQETAARAEAEAARVEAQAANRAKDEFLAVLSHELRTPLHAILGWNSILKRQHDPATLARANEIIERHGKHQLRLIEDLMDMARVVGGKLQLKIEPVELTTVVAAALDAVRAAAEAKRITLACDLRTEAVRVMADPDRLQQVVWNLLSNAVKFTPEGGSVTVELDGDAGHVSLVVRDTGIGIPRDFLPYVFDRFRQADASTARRFGGLGLGLALVRHVVEMHGGTAEVASDGEDRGAIFTIRLPAAVHAPQAVPREGATRVRPAQEAPLAGIRVLVVDDEPDGIDFLAVALGISGAKVTGASSGDEVLRRLFDAGGDGAGYDLLLADVGMPEMDGYTLLRRIRAMNGTPTAAVPAIAITAYTRSEDRAAALEAGFDAHMAKPVDPKVLVDLICALLGRREQTAGEQAS